MLGLAVFLTAKDDESIKMLAFCHEAFFQPFLLIVYDAQDAYEGKRKEGGNMPIQRRKSGWEKVALRNRGFFNGLRRESCYLINDFHHHKLFR